MKRHAAVLLAALPLLLCSCTCRRIGEAPAQLNPSPGTRVATHESGFAFPYAVGNFIRVEMHNFDASGSDSSYGYNDAARLITATVYVYPVPPSGLRAGLQEHTADLMREIRQEHKHLKVTNMQDIKMTLSGAPRDGRREEFEYTEDYAGQKRLLHGDVYLFRYKDYFVKYRFTYPMDGKIQDEAATRSLMSQIAWPKG